MVRMTQVVGLACCCVCLPACSSSYIGGDGGGYAARDGEGPGDDGGTIGHRDAGPVIVPGLHDAGPPEIDVLVECTTTCDHLSACSPDLPRLSCISDCLDTADWITTAECSWLARELFDCLQALDCAEVGMDLERSSCGGIIRRWTSSCAPARRAPPPSPGPPPMPAG